MFHNPAFLAHFENIGSYKFDIPDDLPRPLEPKECFQEYSVSSGFEELTRPDMGLNQVCQAPTMKCGVILIILLHQNSESSAECQIYGM